MATCVCSSWARRAALFLCVTLGLPPAVHSQSISGSISGSVRDPSGLAIAGASAMLINQATNAQRTAATNERGDFLFTAVAPGAYLLRMQYEGFKTFEKSAVNLTASEHLALGNLVLEVGSADQKITVTAEGASVQTASAEHSALVSSTQIEKLLVKGRNVTSLMRLLPGVVDTAEGSSTLATGMQNSEEQISKFFYVNVQGSRLNTTNVTLDGVVLSDPSTAAELNVAIGMDALSEVKVLLGSYQAEYGRMSGADIQLVAKSGARTFHGSGSYFKRHEQFNANSFFNNRLGLRKPWYRYNVWNYGIGGPVFIPGHFNSDRTKLFFHWTQEFWPMAVTNPLRQVTVPTELERAGDFSQSRDQNNAMIVIKDPTTGKAFPDNRIPSSRIDPNGQALLKVLPLPNFLNRSISAGAYNFVSQTRAETPNRVDTFKLDYNIDSNDIVSFTWSAAFRREEGYGTASSVTWPWYSTRIRSRSLFYSWRYQHIFSPTLVNEITTGASQHHGWYTIDPDQLVKMQRKTYGYTAAQLLPANNPAALVPRATFGGVPNAASIAYNYPSTNNDKEVFNFADNLTKIAAPHTLKIGVLIEHIWSNDGPQSNYPGGYFDFANNVNNPLNTGYAFSNAALGAFSQYQEGRPIVYPEYRNHTINWFVQDNWKATRRLTLDLGVRFTWVQPFYEASGNLSGFMMSRYDPSQQVKLIQPAMVNGVKRGVSPVDGTVYPSPSIGAIAPGFGDAANGMVIAKQNSDVPAALAQTPPVKGGPRFGFALDPFGDGKTAIRGGIGLFYDGPLATGSYAVLGTQYPIRVTPTINFDRIDNLTSAPGLIYPQNVVGIDPNIRVASTTSTSLSIQRDVGFGTVVDVSYINTLGRHLWWRRPLSNIPLGANFDPKNADPTNPKVPLSSAFLRPIAGYNAVSLIEAASSSNYNSLQVAMNRRFARRVQFGGNWTWSKAMGFNDTDTETINALTPRRYDYGLASFDRTHAFKFNWLYEFPKTSSQWAPARFVLNGWEVSGIASFVSGAPAGVGFSTTGGVDITGTASQSARIDVTGNPFIPKSSRTFYRNFDTSAFGLPAVGTFGNAAKNLLRGPGINNWDISVFKTFPIGERAQAQFRCQMYNAFNHTQFSAFDTTARFDAAGRQVNANFGSFTVARPPRVMQFQLRATF